MNRRNELSGVTKKLFINQVKKLILGSFLLPSIVLGAMIIARWLAGQMIWQEDDFLWRLWIFLREKSMILVIVLFVVSTLFSAIIALRKVYLNLQSVIVASDSLYEKENQEIVLPEELRDVEGKWNHMKRQMEFNARTAKEAEQRKNDLIVYLAHDLKTPLTSVIGYLTLLHDEGQISEELRTKYLAITLEKAEHLEDLINEFFEITRFNLSNLTLEPSRLNLTRMLEQITYEFKPMLDEKGLVLSLDVPKDLNVIWDIGKMQRVLDNLLRNAVNYSFPEGEIQLLVNAEGDWIEITCNNQGNTIPKEKIDRIFEQFFRLDSSRSTTSGGAGLGLAIAKEIVELHGGTIRAESENEEIRFILHLPRKVK